MPRQLFLFSRVGKEKQIFGLSKEKRTPKGCRPFGILPPISVRAHGSCPRHFVAARCL